MLLVPVIKDLYWLKNPLSHFVWSFYLLLAINFKKNLTENFQSIVANGYSKAVKDICQQYWTKASYDYVLHWY